MYGNERIRFEEPGFARFHFASTTAAWIWLPVRLYLGYEWARAGWERSSATPRGSRAPPLKGFIGFALSQAGQGEHSAVNLAWRNAGWIGLDRWVLPALGTPWHPGTLFGGDDRGTKAPA